MKSPFVRRLFAACLVVSWSLLAAAETPPTEPPSAETQPAAPVPDAPPTSAESPPAATPTPETVAPPVASAPDATAPAADGPRKLILLPIEFVVSQKSMAGIETVPEWTEKARFALGDALTKLVNDSGRFRIVELPQLDGGADAVLREHIALFKLVSFSAISMLSYGGKAWASKKAAPDYTIGNGLSFLADSGQADYALILAGAQVVQSGGAIFSQFLSAAVGFGTAGGGTYVMAGIVDLRTGDVRWVNFQGGQQILGMTGSDVRKPETAYEVVSKVFTGFPASPIASFPPF